MFWFPNLRPRMHRNDTHYPILMKFAALTGECQTETRQQVASLVLRSGSDDWVIDQINPVMLQDHKVQDQGQDQDYKVSGLKTKTEKFGLKTKTKT